MKRRLFLGFVMTLSILLLQLDKVQAQSEVPLVLPPQSVYTDGSPFSYISPRPGASLVSAGTTIALRSVESIAPAMLSPDLLLVHGAISGSHQGNVLLADDGRTIMFIPQHPFTPSEVVTVTLTEGLHDWRGKALSSFTFEFTISPNLPNVNEDASLMKARRIDQLYRELSTTLPEQLPQAKMGTSNDRWPQVTLPADMPLITVTVGTDDVTPGYLFLSNFAFSGDRGTYMMIVDNQGEPVFYQERLGIDFNKQPNGLLTYYSAADEAFHALDSSYQIVGTYRAGNGYTIDFHELLLLPNGHAIFMIYDEQKINMDHVVPGGVHAARVTGTVIQEIDTANNVVFEWRSWDHIPIIDTIMPITAATIDYVHGNAIDVDLDGNLLLSGRHLNEITKIDRETGEIIWRLGGKQNQFTFISDADAPFQLQHHIRRLPTGTISLFDNRRGPPSRGVEYLLDESNMTATMQWSYYSAPHAHAVIVGNVERLANGNTLIGWGSTWPTVTEVNANNDKVFEMTLELPQMSYRIHRYGWQGWPTWPATLMIQEDTDRSYLHYSWNGATEVFYYRIYGGANATALEIVDLQQRTGFEEKTDITDLLNRYCFFQVLPIGKNGMEGVASNIVSSNRGCNPVYIPTVLYNQTNSD